MLVRKDAMFSLSSFNLQIENSDLDVSALRLLKIFSSKNKNHFLVDG